MQVQNCFHSKVFKNPFTGEVVNARCQKCPACLNARSSNWVMRLDMEASCHKYVLFTTLTYDEQNVSQIIRLRYEDYKEKGFGYIGENGELIETKEIKEQFSDRDWQYCRESKVINRLDKADFQKFIKRLRYFFSQCDKGATLRYYLCGEYGPTTYRPHGHMLLFFDSAKCAREIEVLLSKSWKYGIIYDPHFVSGSASEYCASYLNSLGELPKIYLHRHLRPFTLFSKSPAIGSLYPSLSKVKELFDSGDIKFRRYDKISGKFCDEYLPRAVESRLYPRCQRFSSLSASDRIILYRKIEEFAKYPWLTAIDIAKRLKHEYIDGKSKNSFIGRYLFEISHKRKYAVRFQKDNIPDVLSTLPFAPLEPIEIGFLSEKIVVREFCFDSLVRFVRCLLRVREQSRIFGYSISDYVKKIVDYYDKKSLQRLKDDYAFQDEYFAYHPKWHLIYFDRSFYDKVLTVDFDMLSIYSHNILSFLFNGKIPLHVVDGKTIVDIPPLDELQNFQAFKQLHIKIAHDLTKQKKNNDYALTKKDKFSNIINFQNI